MNNTENTVIHFSFSNQKPFFLFGMKTMLIIAIINPGSITNIKYIKVNMRVVAMSVRSVKRFECINPRFANILMIHIQKVP